ncbi:MAG: cytochrome c [Acidimicrobiia bacterium]|nr:cytochrome c [Acidimicrobiia bacterium]MDH5504895.1 cytochrome c [Acidimicrobiia bacterium]
MRLVGFLVIVLLLTASCTSVDPTASAIEVYEQACARCHGNSMGGGVGPALGPGSDAESKPDESLLTAITNGRARMPSFRNQLTEAQIRGLVEYIRTVQRDG